MFYKGKLLKNGPKWVHTRPNSGGKIGKNKTPNFELLEILAKINQPEKNGPDLTLKVYILSNFLKLPVADTIATSSSMKNRKSNSKIPLLRDIADRFFMLF